MKKRTIYILILMAVLLLGGCGQAGGEAAMAGFVNLGTSLEADGTAAVAGAAIGPAAETSTGHGNFSEMATIHIEAEEEPGEEYMLASISASWTGQELEAVPVEIKLRGNSSKESEKKAYTVKFEEEQELMGMSAGKKWALVSDPFDKSLLRPVIAFGYAEAIGLPYVSETRLCQLWLGDRYMGVYTVMEPIEAGEPRVDIDVEDGDFLLERNLARYEGDVFYLESSAGLRFEFNEPEEPTEEEMQQCYDLLAQAEEAIFTGDHREYSKYIDVHSFVNFYIFNEMMKDVDFGEYSTRYYFKDGVMYAGPPWDMDLTQGNASAEKPEFKYYTYNNLYGGGGDTSEDSSRGLWANTGDYYYWLCQDPWFCEKVQQRWQALRAVTENLATDNELGQNMMDLYLEAHLEQLEGNFSEGGRSADEIGTGARLGEGTGARVVPGDEVAACWRVDVPENASEWQEPADSYMGNVEMLRQWLVKRAAYLDAEFGQFIFEPEKAVL